MDSYTIAICLKSNANRVVGTFLTMKDKMVTLGNAFFEASPEIVFPTIVVCESDITGVEKIAECEPRGLQKMGGRKEDKGDWNQFRANSRLFNIQPEFDEQEYMDVQDKDSEGYKSKLGMAQRIEQEILSSASVDAHTLEECGESTAGDNDDAYSSVVEKPREEVRRKMVIEIEGFSPECARDEPESAAETGARKITYGWMNTKFESSRNMIETMRPKFKGVLECEDTRWGSGPSWEAVGKGILNRSTKTRPPMKQMSRKPAASK